MIAVPRATARRFYLAFDPEFEPEECQMKFRLTYDGPLLGSSSSSPRARHKHEIRKVFHPQLKRLWEVEPNLRSWKTPFPDILENQFMTVLVTEAPPPQVAMVEALANNYVRGKYRFVPLATESASLIAGVEVLFLRTGIPGEIIRSADIDARLKTLFDALRMPDNEAELGGYTTPDDGEDPFFVLLQDDKLISHVSVETDTLLQPSNDAERKFLDHDARLVISVHLKPYYITLGNLNFV